MPNIQVVGDPNTGGGLVETPSQDFYTASQKLISIDGTAVTPHGDGDDAHNDAHTANGSSFFKISGKPVNLLGNADTCLHTRSGPTVNWFIIGG